MRFRENNVRFRTLQDGSTRKRTTWKKGVMAPLSSETTIGALKWDFARKSWFSQGFNTVRKMLISKIRTKKMDFMFSYGFSDVSEGLI